MNIKTFIILMLILPLAACSSAQKKPAAAVIDTFSVPESPAVLTTPEQKAEFDISKYLIINLFSAIRPTAAVCHIYLTVNMQELKIITQKE